MSDLHEMAKAAADATVPEDSEGYSREKWFIARDAVIFAGQALVPTPPAEPAGEEPVAHKPWYQTDAHRDLSRIIPDMQGKISEAKVLYDHCLPKHLFAPLEGSITELMVLRHELADQAKATPSNPERLVEAVQHLLHVGEFCRNDDTESALRRVRTALSATPLKEEGE